ncbi:hypothetical protein C4H12_08640 [Capnocytophaga sp. oral taxon 878]|nr:hypothetical protein C4H12_08640 [Capnocytophaga sp. oral taxon 878]
MLLLLIAACQNKKESFKSRRDWGAMAQAVMESKEMKHIANPAMTIIKTDNVIVKKKWFANLSNGN